jgi:protein tyrosine/serine phosphatase
MLVNFHDIEPGLSRSGRPQPGDFTFVKSIFKTVLSLEGLEEDLKEEELDPVKVLSFPISPFEIYLLGVSQKKLGHILDAIERAPKPLLVHCQHGEDRTGLVIAAWRVRHGWTKQAAKQEADRLGYRWYINFGLNHTWRKFQ